MDLHILSDLEVPQKGGLKNDLNKNISDQSGGSNRIH